MEEIRESDRMLSVREVAKYLGVSTATVYKMCEKDELPNSRVSNAIRVHPKDLAALARRKAQST